MTGRLRRCPACGAESPTAALVLVDDGLPIRQHRAPKRRCPTCGAERLARLFAIVRRRPPADASPRLVA